MFLDYKSRGSSIHVCTRVYTCVCVCVKEDGIVVTDLFR